MALTTIAAVEGRLGRPLTATEDTQVDYLIPALTNVFSAIAGTDIDDLDPFPGVLGNMAVEIIVRTILTPAATAGVASETLGAHSVTYVRDGGGFTLTKTDELLIREAVWGSLSGSSSPRALPDRIIDLNEYRDVDEPVVDA